MDLKARRILLGLTALLLCSMLLIFVYRSERRPVELHARQATETSIHNSLSVQGVFEPVSKSMIAAAESVLVKERYVQPGETVTIGDPLLRLENVSQESGGISEALATYFDRIPTDNIQSGAVLYADKDGVVTTCAAEGTHLFPAQTAVCISDYSQGRIEIEVPELYAAGIHIGQTAKASPVSVQGIELSGILSEIDAQITEKYTLLEQAPDRVVKCVISVPEITNLRPGTSMDVSIITDSVKQAVVVPYSAVRQEEKQEYIFVVSEKGIEKRPVTTGYHLSSEIQIETGVRKGEWVLTDEEIPGDLSAGYVVIPL